MSCLSRGDGASVLRGKALVVDASGLDVTERFLKGAREACALAGLLGVSQAVLKERSPSCATHEVWIDGRLCPGMGVTAAMLREMGVLLMNEKGEPVP
jgi:uncharacterized protein YbbK (DUF523 family)